MGCNCNSTTIPNGIDGENAYTFTTASYVQPAVNTNVTITVSNTGQYTGEWAVPGQTIFIEDGGYYIVVSSTATQIVAKYESDYATFNQALTAIAAPVATGRSVSPAGKKGEDGVDGTDGVIILDSYLDLTGTGNDAGTGDSTLRTYTVPANTLLTNGDYLDIDIYYDYADNDKCIMKFKFGGSTFVTYNEWAADPTKNITNIQISRISATSQLWTFNNQRGNSSSAEHTAYINQGSLSATLSNTNDFDIVVDNTVIGANQVILKKCVIKKISI